MKRTTRILVTNYKKPKGKVLNVKEKENPRKENVVETRM